jgi:TetR/AcrR family transcriptional regulator, transcriptional repressor for nem operon
MTKAERTRSFIIESTAPLFNTKGYDGTSLHDLCEATGLTKGALYGNFDNKDALFVAAFEFAIHRMRQEGSKYVDKAVTNKDKLKALLNFFSTYVLDPPVKGGCPLLNNAVDADDHRPQMKKVIARELQRQVEHIAGLLEKGKAAGEFAEKFNPKEMAMFFFCAVEGAIMYSRVSSSDDAMKAVTANINRMVDALTGNNS